MVLPGMNLFDDAAYPWTVVSNHHEQVFGDKIHAAAHLHDLDVCKTLPVCADFVLALHDEYAAAAQDPVRFTGCFPIDFQNRFVVLGSCSSPSPVVGIVFLERRVGLVGRASRGMHIRRIQDDTVDGPIPVGKASAVNAVLDIGCTEVIYTRWDIPPEDPFAVGHVGNDTARLYIQRQNTRNTCSLPSSYALKTSAFVAAPF